jgi:hypothetical protein
MTPNDNLKIYLRSYIDKDVSDGFTLSGDFVSPENATDRSKTTYCATSGLGTDGDSADFEVDMLTDRDVGSFALKSNLKTFNVYYWDGAAYQLLAAYSANADEFLVFDAWPSNVTTQKIKITATHTITADEEKKIYLFDITKSIASLEPEKIKIERDHAKANFTNIYSGSVQVVKYPNHPKVKIDLSFKNLQGAKYTAYDLLKSQSLTDSFIVYLYMTDDYTLQGPESWHLVNDITGREESPGGNNFASGVVGDVNLREC